LSIVLTLQNPDITGQPVTVPGGNVPSLMVTDAFDLEKDAGVSCVSYTVSVPGWRFGIVVVLLVVSTN